MKFAIFATAAMAATLAAGGAIAGTAIVDGTLDAAYGAASGHVTYDPAAPNNNTPTSATAGTTSGESYDLYVTSDASNVYGFVKYTGTGTSAGPFANLYFDVDSGNGMGADIGFEITNDLLFSGAFSIGVPITSFTSADGIEFAIPNAVFAQVFAMAPNPNAGGVIRLVESQSFGYTFAGGSFGSVVLGGVPEPASWALMLMGFGGLGAALRVNRRKSATVA